VVGGTPAFLVREKGAIFTTDRIEFEDKIVKALPSTAYLNKPYSFAIGEVEKVIEAAKTETLDTLYRKVKSIWKRYVDADDFHISICAADTIFTYYQDRLGLVHYLFFVGGPSSGKSNRLEVFRFLAYRNWTSSDITPTNIYQLLGSREEGMATLCEDEADNLDLNFDKMRIYKLGYTTGRYVSRIDNDGGRVQLKFFTFCWKAFAAERLPDSVMARGFLQRIIDLQCTYGFPQYDILEVENPANTTKFAELLQELEETRNLLLMHRMIHFNEKIPDIPLNIINRESQLFKPILRVFQKTETMKELFPVISEYINQKRAANANSLHAYVYDRVVDLIKNEGQYEIESKAIWEHVIDPDKCPGDFIPHKPLSYLSVDHGEISRKQITEICKDVLGAKSPRRHGSSRGLMFDPKKLKQLENFYNLSLQVKVKENGTDGMDGTLSGSVGLDKHFTKPKRSKRKSSTKDTPYRLPGFVPSVPSVPRIRKEMTNEEFELFDNMEQQSSFDVRELICCETIRSAGYTIIQCTPATGTLFITDDNPGFISGQARMRGKNEGRYPYKYLEMIDTIFGYEPNTIEVCSRSVPGGNRGSLFYG